MYQILATQSNLEVSLWTLFHVVSSVQEIIHSRNTLTVSNEIGLDGIQVEKESVTRGRFFTVASARTQKERETREGSLSGWRKIRG